MQRSSVLVIAFAFVSAACYTGPPCHSGAGGNGGSTTGQGGQGGGCTTETVVGDCPEGCSLVMSSPPVSTCCCPPAPVLP